MKKKLFVILLLISTTFIFGSSKDFSTKSLNKSLNVNPTKNAKDFSSKKFYVPSKSLSIGFENVNFDVKPKVNFVEEVKRGKITGGHKKFEIKEDEIVKTDDTKDKKTKDKKSKDKKSKDKKSKDTKTSEVVTKDDTKKVEDSKDTKTPEVVTKDDTKKVEDSKDTKTSEVVTKDDTKKIEEEPFVDKKNKVVERQTKFDVFNKEIGNEFLYYRKNLNSTQQKVYDEAYNAILNCEEVLYLQTEIKKTEIRDALFSIFFDNPELFWWGSECSYSSNTSGIVISVKFRYLFPKEQLEKEKETFRSLSLPVLFYANMLETDMQKIKYIHDYICLSTEYDYDSLKNNELNEKRILQTAYSTIVQYKTVCAGYSKAMAYYLQQLRIPCVSVYGSGHEWNMVQLDGAFYQLDVTWDDSCSAIPQYFNLTHTQMQKVESHTLEDLAKSVIKKNSKESTKNSYKNIFGDMPTGNPFTYQEFNNFERDVKDPSKAVIYTK